MAKEICFSDSIEFITSSYDFLVYTPVFSVNDGVYLKSDDEKDVRELVLYNSLLTLYYTDGEVKTLDDSIISVEVSDTCFRRVMKKGLQGSLFKYTMDDALLYDLDNCNVIPKELAEHKTRKRSL